MTLDILVVDDSPFFQKRLAEIINEHPQLNVIGFANNGQEAVDQVKKLNPDLVTMDYEMPMMDGVSAVRIIMSENPLPILMLSSMTFPDAKITIDALEAGAVDFITKNFSEISNKSTSIKKHLYQRLLAIGERILQRKKSHTTQQTSQAKANHQTAQPCESKHTHTPSTRNQSLFSAHTKPRLVVLGASTGGPAALTEVLKKIPANFPLPILIIQHMPENFTEAFAQRLNHQCRIDVQQADDGAILKAGQALIAPGGKQLIIDKNNPKRVKVTETTQPVNYRPCVDISFASVCNAYGKDTLAVVFTGMGHDGRDGARLLKQQGATIWTQDKDSCVVYGMPMAIDQENLSNASLTLTQISEQLAKL